MVGLSQGKKKRHHNMLHCGVNARFIELVFDSSSSCLTIEWVTSKLRYMHLWLTLKSWNHPLTCYIFFLAEKDRRLSIYSVWWINCVPNSKSNQCATQVELYGYVVESLTYKIESYMCNSLNVLTILKCNVHNLSSSEFRTHQTNVVLI